MSVTTQTYTTNSKKIIINYEFGNGSTNIISAVNSAITGLGWTQYDSIVASGNNPVSTYVYRVLNYDGTTYKYLILRWDTVKLFFYTSTCESWNFATHVPTNESYTASGAFGQGYDIVNGFIIVSATARHVMLWSFINGQPGLWSAVIEFERVVAEDTVALANPCWAWTCSTMIGTNFGTSSGTAGPQMFAFPRTPDGSTGLLASSIYVPVTNRGMHPPRIPTATTLTFTDATNNFGHLGSFSYSMNYAWNNIAQTISTITIDAGTAYPTSAPSYQYLMPMGRAFNLGVTKSYGNPGDTTSANIDSAGGWPSVTGTATESILLPMVGGWEGYSAYGPGQFSNTYANIGPSIVACKAVGVGDTVFIAAANTATGQGGIHTISQSGGFQQPPVFRANIPGGVYDIVFDGNGYIYGSTANGIVQMNANTFSTVFFTSNQTIQNGGAYLGIDNKNVYMSNRQANVSPQIYNLDRATGNIYFGNTYILPQTTIGATGLGTPVPDYSGNVFAFQTAGSAATQTLWFGKYQASTAANLGINIPPTGNAAINYGSTGYYDWINNRLYNIVPTPASSGFIVYEHWAANLWYTGNNATINAGPVTTTYYNSSLFGTTTADTRGELCITPWRGTFAIGVKRPGAINSGTQTGAAGFGSFSSLYGASNIGAPFNLGVTTVSSLLLNSTVLALPYGGSGTTTTNGVQLFATYGTGTVPAGDNRVYVINGMYGVNNNQGGPTARLTLKG